MIKSCEHIEWSKTDGVRLIKLNRPSRKNAFNTAMYSAMASVLNVDAACDDVVVTVITGAGDYFSSGNDIKDSLEQMADTDGRLDHVKSMVRALIQYPKLLVAVVNGPAIGIAATLVGLCDVVYASDRASFSTPFVRLGLCVEGASSFTFPFTLGRSRTSEMVFLGRPLSASEAHRAGFVSEVVPHSQLEQFIRGLHQYGTLPVEAVKRNKQLILGNLEAHLLASNERESTVLKDCIQSDEFIANVMKFVNKKSKL